MQHQWQQLQQQATTLTCIQQRGNRHASMDQQPMAQRDVSPLQHNHTHAYQQSHQLHQQQYSPKQQQCVSFSAPLLQRQLVPRHQDQLQLEVKCCFLQENPQHVHFDLHSQTQHLHIHDQHCLGPHL